MAKDASADSSEEEQLKRQKITVILILTGTAVLILPLIVVAYLHMKGNDSERAAGAGPVFERRMGDSPAPQMQMAAPAMAMQKSLLAPVAADASSKEIGGSLGYIRGGQDYAEQPKAEIVADSPKPKEEEISRPQPPSAPPANPMAEMMKKMMPQASAPTARASKFPKLKPMSSGSFAGASKFGSKKSSAKPAAGAPPGMPPGMDINQIMKMMPQAQPGAGATDQSKK